MPVALIMSDLAAEAADDGEKGAIELSGPGLAGNAVEFVVGRGIAFAPAEFSVTT